MEKLINQSNVASIFNDKRFYIEFKQMLNELIDAELNKDVEQMDCDLIDECTNMLIELEQQDENGMPVIIPLIPYKRIIKACENHNFKKLSAGVRASIVAGLVLVSAISCNEAVYQISGKNIGRSLAYAVVRQLDEWGVINYSGNFDDDYMDFDGNENMDAGCDDDDETEPTTQPVTKPNTPKPTEPTTSEPIGNENMDAGCDDDEETTKPTAPKPRPTTPSAGSEQIIHNEKTYTVSFDSDGAGDFDSVQVIYRKAIGELPVPHKDGYIFLGWENIDIGYKYTTSFGISIKSAVPVKADTLYMVERDSTLKAHWIKVPTISFDAGEGSCDVESMQTNDKGMLDTIPVPTQEGYVFDCWWYYGEKGVLPIRPRVKVTENTVFTEDTVLYASFVVDVSETTLKFDANGGKCSETSRTVTYGEPYGELPIPTRDGYIFTGWHTSNDVNSKRIESDTINTSRIDRTVYATWATSATTISFDNNGGTGDFADVVAYTDENLNLPIPELEGYQFVGWYVEDAREVQLKTGSPLPSSQTNKDRIVAVAKWTPAKVDITFDACGGVIDKKYNYYYLSEYGTLPTATIGGYQFDGWFTEPEGGEKIESTDVINTYEPFTLYAHYTKLDNVAVVTVHTNRSVETVYEVNVEIGQPLGELKRPTSTTPTESSFSVFLGWFDDALYGNEITADTIITEDMDIYAHWTISNFKITIIGLKDVYQLDEPFNYDDIVIKATFLGTDVPMMNAVNEYGIENCLFGVDTTVAGEHELVFKLAAEEFDIVGMGTVCLETKTTYTVTGCRHENGTKIVNAKAPTCKATGYSGNTICVDCGYIFKVGKTLPAIPHDENTEYKLLYVKAATCINEGYTGDKVCTECSAILERGKYTPKLKHNPQLVNEMEPTCMSDGNTGDMQCTMCGQYIKFGDVIPRLPHTTELRHVREATCSEEGNTGDLVCIDCGTIVERGTSIPKLTTHEELELINYRPSTGTKEGYTGDMACSLCGDIIEQGEVIPRCNHQTIKVVGAVESTCCEDGYTGDWVCTECGDTVSKGEVVSHPEIELVVINQRTSTCDTYGYTGDKACANCGRIIEHGQKLKTALHENIQIVGAYEPIDCAHPGYTGDKVCMDCDTVVDTGDQIFVEHTWDYDNPQTYVAPTCTEDGYKSGFTCTVCGIEGYGWIEPVPALGHDTVDVINKGGLNVDGYFSSECSRCGKTVASWFIPSIASVELDQTRFNYNGGEYRPKVIVKDTYGNLITSYEAEYPEDSREIGFYQIKLTFTGDYEGTYTLGYSIEGVANKCAVSYEVLFNNIKINWTAISNVDGYQIQIKDGDRVVRSISTDFASNSKETPKVNIKTGYYIVVRGFNTVNGEKVYTEWSDKVYIQL